MCRRVMPLLFVCRSEGSDASKGIEDTVMTDALRRIGGVRRPSRRRRRPYRHTPLHCAARYGHSASVAELLLRGADGAVQHNFG